MTGKKLLRTLRRLQHERDREKRTEIIELGRKALMKWFLAGAKHLLKGVIPINKQTQRFIDKHRDDLSVIANKKVNDDNRIKAILKRGGAGFVGGVIIRHLLKWNLANTRTAKPKKRRLKSVVINPKAPKTRKLPQWMVDIGKTASSKTKAPRKTKGIKKGQKLIVKLPTKNHKQIVFTQPPPNTTIAMLKQGQKKMDRAMTGPIGIRELPIFNLVCFLVLRFLFITFQNPPRCLQKWLV